MMMSAARVGIICLLVLSPLQPAWAQRIETENGVRVVHNVKGGAWGNNPQISIELVRKIGDVDSDDENLAFNSPADLAVDADGKIYIADSRNQRIQVFDREGRYIRTIGRKGQGPGEFMATHSIDFDSEGRLHVLDSSQGRIQAFTPKGELVRTVPISKLGVRQMRFLRSGLMAVESNARGPKLAQLLGPELAPLRAFGEPFDYGDELTNDAGNSWELTIDNEDNIALGFRLQNRIEKFSPDGRLLWRADRELNYSTKVVEQAKREGSGTHFRISYPRFNSVSKGLAADGSGRIWVVTCSRQIRKDEEVIVMVEGFADGRETRKVMGDTERRTTDMFKLEIFAPDGVLLGEIPLTHFVDMIRIHKDRLFLLDADRGVCFYEYKFVEK